MGSKFKDWGGKGMKSFLASAECEITYQDPKTGRTKTKKNVWKNQRFEDVKCTKAAESLMGAYLEAVIKKEFGEESKFKVLWMEITPWVKKPIFLNNFGKKFEKGTETRLLGGIMEFVLLMGNGDPKFAEFQFVLPKNGKEEPYVQIMGAVEDEARTVLDERFGHDFEIIDIQLRRAKKPLAKAA